MSASIGNRRTSRRGSRSRWRRSRTFNIFVLITLIISVGLLGLAILDQNAPAPAISSDGDDSITTFAMFDAGQGLATALVTENGDGLVYDFGLRRDDMEQEIVPFLREHGVDAVDYAILSHPHQDHLGGLPAMIDSIPIDLFLDPVVDSTNQTYAHSLELILERDIPGEVARQGSTYSLGDDVEIEILWPEDDLLTDSNGEHEANANSTVAKVSVEDVSILLTGDIERESEEHLIDTYGDELDIDILQVAHHGSYTSSNDPFLLATTPDVALVSAGFENQYGHPHDEVIQRLRAHEIEIYRTDLDGTIVITTDGESFEIETRGDGRE